MLPMLAVFVFSILQLNVAKKSNVVVTLHGKDIAKLFTVDEIWGIQYQDYDPTADIVKAEVVIDDTKLKNITALGKETILGIDIIWPDADEIIRKERERINNTARWTPDMKPDIFFQEYRDWPTYELFIAEMLIRFPGLVSIQTLDTQTIQGRYIPVVKLSTDNDPTKPGFWIQGCIHAREWLACAAVTKILNSLAEGYGNDDTISNILDNMNIFIVPVMNVDGYIYSWEVSRYWRKNRRNNGDGSFGVDLNRNYDGPEGTWCSSGASTNPSSDSYCGTSAFSEPETVAGTEFILDAQNNIKAAFDMHTSGQFIMWPWAFTPNHLPEDDYSLFCNLGEAMEQAVTAVNGYNYTSIQCAPRFLAAGSSMDFAWTYSNGETYGFGFEGRGPGFNPPPENIIPGGEEQLAAVITVADYILGNGGKKKDDGRCTYPGTT